MTGKQRIFALVFFFTMATGPGLTAFADEYQTVEESSAQEVVNAMGTKAGRGLANTATGWLEFPKQIYVTAKEGGAAKAIFIGPFKGIGMTIARTLAGVGELATFFVPYPGFYDPYIEPSYVWQKE
ncbi:MAG TPA: exosortase system-associated protein, TIGR04073 family [Geobacteraceae bacterium]|nr:exosortase system-associated protein, TIGR04073 family [Geobacteraceae bacterium]